jgi:hypothetical protein
MSNTYIELGVYYQYLSLRDRMGEASGVRGSAAALP